MTAVKISHPITWMGLPLSPGMVIDVPEGDARRMVSAGYAALSNTPPADPDLAMLQTALLAALDAAGAPQQGVGSPEGVVTATVGTEYVDTAATNGAIKWIKASGTGNTGWTVTRGDTGWRNVTSLLHNPADYAGGTMRIRRINETVHWEANALQRVADAPAGAVTVYPSMTVGFRPAVVRHPFFLTRHSSLAIKGWFYTASAGVYFTQRETTSGYSNVWLAADPWSGGTSWLTDNAWPTTLPGVAA